MKIVITLTIMWMVASGLIGYGMHYPDEVEKWAGILVVGSGTSINDITIEAEYLDAGIYVGDSQYVIVGGADIKTSGMKYGISIGRGAYDVSVSHCSVMNMTGDGVRIESGPQ